MRASALALLASAGVLLAAALFFGGGSSDGPVAWIGGAAVLAAAAMGCAALWGWLPVPRLGREGLACAALAAAFVVWNGVTILWSSAPDRSWSYFNRGLVYLAFGVVGAFVGAVVAPRLVASLVGGLVTATCPNTAVTTPHHARSGAREPGRGGCGPDGRMAGCATQAGRWC